MGSARQRIRRDTIRSGLLALVLHSLPQVGQCGQTVEEIAGLSPRPAALDRRVTARPDSSDRRSPDRLDAPTCSYCSTDTTVRTIRRTPQEVYFVCSVCEAMWALPRSNARSGHAPAVMG